MRMVWKGKNFFAKKKKNHSIINKQTVLIFKNFWKELNLLINIEFINIKHY